MKKFIKTVLLALPGIIFTLHTISGQEVRNTSDKQNAGSEKLSEEQITLLKANRSKQIELRNAFRETLTGNQLDILTDNRLTKEDKLNAFRRSLSKGQVQMVNSSKKQIRMQKNTLRNTFSNQQRMQIRRMAANRSQQNRILYQRARLKKRFL